MAAASQRYEAYGEVTNYYNPFMSLTAVGEGNVEIKMDYVNKRNDKSGHFNPFLSEEEPVKMRPEAQKPHKPRFSSTNPFFHDEWDSYCMQDCVGNMQSKDQRFHGHNHQAHAPPLKLHHIAMPPAAVVATPHTNPFSPAGAGSYVQSTPVNCHPPCSTCPGLHTPCCDPPARVQVSSWSSAKVRL